MSELNGMREPLWTSAEVAEATRGQCALDWTATGISIDSRTLAPGDLFFAIAGPTFDGHDFVDAAFARGAAAAVVSRAINSPDPSRPLLQAEDTLQALRDLGSAARARTEARVIGVTGSVGKTGVKEALATVLGPPGPVHATLGSLNNHWGLPLSLARLPRQSRYAVFEMGMNHPGEIRPLSRLARPHVAVITTVDAVHKAHFTSVEEIATAKAEIFEGVTAGGAAVLNRDNPHFQQLATAASASGVANVVAFGRHPDAGVRLIAAAMQETGTHVQARIGGEELSYDLSVAGDHWVQNSLCVLATVATAGGDVRSAAAELAKFTEPKGRGLRRRLRLPQGVITLIDDSYNASPVSMTAAFAVLGQSRPASGGRKIAVIGDMLELGDDAPTVHASLAPSLQDAAIDQVFCAGPMMAHLFDALPKSMRGAYAADAEAVIPMVLAALRDGDVAVVKGSAGSRMGLVVKALVETADTQEPATPLAGAR